MASRGKKKKLWKAEKAIRKAVLDGFYDDVIKNLQQIQGEYATGNTDRCAGSHL